MSVQVLFCSSGSVLSEAIKYFTEEPVSHVALLVDKKWVVHSNLRGVHVQIYSNFLKTYDIYAMTDPVPTDTPIELLLAENSFKGYDVLAILYLGLRFFLKKVLKFRLPKVNLWQSTGMYMCTEWVSFVLEGSEDSTITPYGLYKKYKARIKEAPDE